MIPLLRLAVIHRPRSRRGQWPARLLKLIDDLLNDFAQFFINLDGIIAVDARNQIRALADVNLVLIAPFNPSMILVDLFHVSASLIARFTYQKNRRGSTLPSRTSSAFRSALLLRQCLSALHALFNLS